MISFAIGTVVAFRNSDPEYWEDSLPAANDAGQLVITNVSLSEDGLEYAVNGEWGFTHDGLEFVGEATDETLDYSIGIEVGDDSGEDDDEGYGEDDDYDPEASDDEDEESDKD